MAKINGQQDAGAAGKTLAVYLAEQGYGLSRVAVERNGEIVPRMAYPAIQIEEGDVLEIVGFVGGG